MKGSVFFKILFINLIFFTWGTHTALANNQPLGDYTKECERLLAAGNKLFQNKEYQKALQYFTKAEALADKNKITYYSYASRQNIGNVYSDLSNSGEALNYFNEAYEIALKETKSERNVAIILNSVGILYHKDENYKEALAYYKKAYNITLKVQDDLFKSNFAVNIAAVSNELGNYDEAIKYLEQVEGKTKNEEIEQAWRICYAESLLHKGETDKAEHIVKQLFSEIKDRKNYRNNLDVMILFAKIYNAKGQLDLGISYARRGLAYNKNIGLLHWNVPLLEQLSDLYFKKGDYKTGRRYIDSIFITKDSISKLLKLQLFESNKIKFDVQEYQNELQISKEKNKAERTLFIIGILSSLMFFFFIYRGLKNRIIKQKQEKIITENQQKIVSLEMEGLKNNIAEKNRKLSTKALYLSGRNELIEEVINSLAKIPEVFHNKEVTNYIKTLKDYLKTDAEWDEFIAYFEQVNHDFFRALKTRHPQLTPQDIRFLCYIYMNLDIKEISTIFSITSEAGRKRKQRIAKKMDIDIDDLHDYILKIQ
jgi:tetratricopeptide (TPR) repeat protein